MHVKHKCKHADGSYIIRGTINYQKLAQNEKPNYLLNGRKSLQDISDLRKLKSLERFHKHFLLHSKNHKHKLRGCLPSV